MDIHPGIFKIASAAPSSSDTIPTLSGEQTSPRPDSPDMDTTPVHGIPPCNGIRLTAISNEPEKYRITLASGDCLTGTAHAIAFTGSVDTPHVIDSHQALKR